MKAQVSLATIIPLSPSSLGKIKIVFGVGIIKGWGLQEKTSIAITQKLKNGVVSLGLNVSTLLTDI